MNQIILDTFHSKLLETQWQIGRYRFEFSVTEEIRFPEYAGSTIRGAFGQALRRTACMTHMKDCKSCPLYHTCPYTYLFETPAPLEHRLQRFSQIPNPYVIEAPNWGRKNYQIGENLQFSVVLFGKAINQLALVIYALKRAFAYDVGHGKADLKRVYFCPPIGQDELIFEDGQSTMIDMHQSSLSLHAQNTESKLKFLTPLRLQNNGKALSVNEITSHNFLMALVRRIGLLSDFHQNIDFEFPYHDLKEAALESSINVNFHWQDWIRYSNRQQQKMHMGGVLGEVELGNLHPAFSALLELGQWTHIGKSATFGMGRYIL